MKTIYVRPAPGRKLGFEDTNAPIPKEGAHVPESQHYLRRLRDGDAVPGEAPSKPAEPTEPKTAVRRTRRKREE